MIKRPGLIQTDRKTKINLPGALINRSPLKNAENSSMISNTSFSSDTACENHPNKRGKYMVMTDEIEDEEQTYYCEKCAILLASKGFEVKKLEHAEQRTTEKKKLNPRQQQLSNFVRGLSQKINALQENKRDAAQQLSDIEDNYEDKVQKVQQFFEELYITLERHKNKEVHEIALRKKAAEEELATYLGYATEKVELLETMKQDIVSSHESIVKDTPEQDYQLVMSHYQATISQLKFEPVSAVFADSSLPSVETIENLLAELFENGRSSSYFSFDSSKKNYE